MTAREQVVPLPVSGYEKNAEFLKAKYEEVALRLQCAGLRRKLRQRDRPSLQGSGEAAEEPTPGDPLRQRMAASEQELKRQQGVVEARLDRSDASEVPFLGLLERCCGVTDFDGQVLWLLFFMALSPELRDQYEQLELGEWDGRGGHGMCIGDLLRVLCNRGVDESMESRARFGVDAPLIAHHLVQMDSFDGKPSILDVEVRLPQRVVSWLSGDTHRYPNDSPCRVEWTTEAVEHVVMEDGVIGRLLRMVDHYEEFRARRQDLGLAEAASYGSALVILEHGPPGTGKTLLARALARRAGRPLVSLMNPSRYSLDAEDLECLFREARLQDGILFIDECEHLGSPHSGELPVLLRELEHFEGIVVMATNYPQELGSQLDRRCTVKVPFALPSESARRRIWELHLGSAPLAADVDLARLAREYPMPGGYIKNSAQTAVNEALAREGEVTLRRADLEAACQLQEDRVCEGPRVGRRYRPRQLVDELVASEELRERLRSLARALVRKEGLLGSWLGAESPQFGGARLLFQGGGFEAAMAAADAVAAEMDRPVLRVRLGELSQAPGREARGESWEQDWPFGLIEAAAQAGQIVAIADPLGRLVDKEDEAGQLVRGTLAGCTESRAVLFVVSGGRFRGLRGWDHLLHEAVDVTTAGAETRAEQWRQRLGRRAGAIDVEGLAEAFPVGASQMQLAIERAALRAGAAGETELVEEQLREAVRGVTGRAVGEGLFG